jgi:gamma-D-glutamyl-L-lysine dipeptidyl-peptidase
MFGICNLSIVPCRKEPSDKSEMVTQLLFGEHFELLEVNAKWTRIRTAFDTYECWIDNKQLLVITEQLYKTLNTNSPTLVADVVQVMHNKTANSVFPVVVGSVLPGYTNKLCKFDRTQFIYEGHISKQSGPNKKGIIESAYLYLNTPYLWGGRSPFGIDCSGFTQLVYKLNGIPLLRDAYQQAAQGTVLSFVEEAEPGDLAFFDNDQGNIIHVGIILSGNKIIHASGRVRVDKFDHQGIYNQETKQYSHHLRLIKRVV